MADFLGNIVGAVLGGLIGNANQRDAAEDSRFAAEQSRLGQEAINARNIAFQQEANAQNLALARETQGRNEALAREMASENEALQREFAQMGIRWRVEDAKAAGLHPLYAIGGAGAAYAPSPTVVHGSPQVTAPRAEWSGGGGGSDFGGGFASTMGQDIGRAIAATMDPVERAERALRLRLLEAQVATESARGAQLRAAADRELRGPSQPVMIPGRMGEEPWMAMDAQNLLNMVQVKPAELVSARGNNLGIEAGPPRPSMVEIVTPSGNRMLIPGKDVAEQVETLPSAMVAGSVIAENLSHYRLLDPVFEMVDKAQEYLWRGYHGARDWVSDRFGDVFPRVSRPLNKRRY